MKRNIFILFFTSLLLIAFSSCASTPSSTEAKSTNITNISESNSDTIITSSDENEDIEKESNEYERITDSEVSKSKTNAEPSKKETSSKDKKAIETSKPVKNEKESTVSKKKESKKKTNLIKYEDSMFWEINSTDKDGNPSKLYILGTIHLGDDRLYPIPESIENAYTNSTKIVGELSTESWELLSVATEKRIEESKENTKENGKKLSDYLSTQQYEYLSNHIDEGEIIDEYEPWFFSYELSQLPGELAGLDSTKSYDIYFLEKSIENKKFIEGLDSLKTQLDALSYGSWDEQFSMLSSTLNDLITDSEGIKNYTTEMYEAYLSNDEKKLSKILDSNVKKNTQYYNSVVIDKNMDWAKKFEEYLSEGGTTFIFAGCAHFVGNDSVFSFMEKDGIIH